MSFFEYCCHFLNNRLTYLNIYKLFSFSSKKHLGHAKNKCKEEGDSLNKGLGCLSIDYERIASLKRFSEKMRRYSFAFPAVTSVFSRFKE